MEDKTTLILELSAPLTLRERSFLNVLWAIVFGPDAGGEEECYFDRERVTYRSGDRSMLAKMRTVLETRAWENAGFLDEVDPALRDAMWLFERTASLGTLLENLASLRGKIVEISFSE